MSVRSVGVTIIMLGFLSTLLAGCIGGEDVEVDDSPEQQAEPDEGLGSVSGRILTISLEPIDGAAVRLVLDDELVTETLTQQQGEYQVTNLEPGQYRLQVSAACCKEAVRAIEVKADETASADLQLEPYSSDDLQEPRVENKDWTGFLACTFRWPTGGVLPYSGINACGLTPGATGDDFLHTFEIGPGLKSIVGGMEWRAPGAALGDELTIYMEVAGRHNAQPRYVYAEGPSPLEYRTDAGWVVENLGENIHEYDFDNVDDSLTLQFRIFAGGDVNVVYQQQFTMYWDLYYWEPAPEGATAIPDL